MEQNFYFIQYKALFWEQFTLAEESKAIEFAAEKFYDAMQDNIAAVAALVTTLNHKCWDWYDKQNEELTNIYADLYYKYNDKAWDWLETNGTDEEKHWYFETMD